MEAYDNHQYALAMRTFERLMEQAPSPSSDAYVEASYFAAMSSLALYHKDAVYRVERFIQQFPEHPLSFEAKWELANYHYKRRSYSSAAKALEAIRPRELSASKRNEYRFKLGHCYFEKEAYEEARIPLYEVIQTKGDFLAPAQYYFSHIAYLNGQPQVALDGFESIADNPDFKELVPLYITQLLHATGQFQRLKEYGPPLLAESSGLDEESVVEVAHLLGDAWYRDEEFGEAASYLELAWEGSERSEKDAEFAYQMGFTRYKLGNWKGALDCFYLATSEDTPLAQNAAYHMADCYLQLQDRARAKQAFKSAATLTHDQDIQEDAFFHYAKLSFELSFNPFDDAIVAFESYLDQFPASPRRDEAHRFLLQVHMTSRNYERALKALGNITDPDETVRAAAQTLAFNRAVELFQNQQLNKALEFFELSRSYNVDPQLHAESYYWEGEIQYKKGDYSRSAEAFATFSTTPGSYLSPLHNDADYARGYAHYKSEQFPKALSAFRSFLETSPDDDPARMRDAELRAADCFYALKSFPQAAEHYDRVLARGIEPLDYSLFQRAMAAKLSGDLEGQIERLESLLSEYSGSRMAVEALYQLGRTNIELDRLTPAEENMNQLISNFPATPRAKQALVELCLVGVKQGDEDKVLGLWDKIKSEYGNDNIAVDAYNIVEPLLIQRGLLGDLPSAIGLDDEAIEARIYEAAAAMFLEGNCSGATDRLNEYLRQYPAGVYVTEAHFNLGNCRFESGDFEASYESYLAVLAMPAGEFTEKAAISAATIAYNAGDFRSALGHYERLEEITSLQTSRLEAVIGQMRCHYKLGQENEASGFANRVMNDPAAPEDIRRTAMLWNARIACNQGRHDDVIDGLAELASFGGASGAEAQYLLAERAFNAKQFEELEAMLFEFISNSNNQKTWQNKGFLLLVSTYIEQEDYFQARATANSILANVSDPDVQESVKDMLLQIENLEQIEKADNEELAPSPNSEFDNE